MRVLVCGSRTWTDWAAVRRAVFDESLILPWDANTIIHGGAIGADSIAGCIAKELGCKIELYLPDWEKYGKSAGIYRNQQMVLDGKPDKVIAFWDGVSRGTKHMVSFAAVHNIPVQIVRPE
jgi:YspA, cpYpsA-related SLOG family